MYSYGELFVKSMHSYKIHSSISSNKRWLLNIFEMIFSLEEKVFILENQIIKES